MEHRGLELVDFRAGAQQLAPVGARGAAGHLRVDVFARHDDAQPDPAAEGGQQGLARQRIGDEVGRRQVDRAFRRGDREQVHQLHAVAAARRRTREHLAERRADRRERGEVRFALQHLASRLDPVVHERSLHLCDRGPFEPVVRVAPVLRVARVAVPLVADADPAGEADLAVDDQQLAVRAVVHAREVVPVQRVEPVHLDARRGHLVQHLLVHLLAAHPVDEQVHAHAGPCAFAQRLGEALPDAARPVDVGLERDRRTSAADRRQHRWKDLDAILEVLDPVTVDDRGPEQDAEFAPELRVRHPVTVLERGLDLALGRHEIQRDDGDAECEHGPDEGREDDALASP